MCETGLGLLRSKKVNGSITRFLTSKNVSLSGTTDLNLKNVMYQQSLKAHENFKIIPWDNLVSTIPIGARATLL